MKHWPVAQTYSLVGRSFLVYGPEPDVLTFAGEWVLVTAAAGGVGIAAVQLAKGNIRVPRSNSETGLLFI